MGGGKDWIQLSLVFNLKALCIALGFAWVKLLIVEMFAMRLVSGDVSRENVIRV